MRHLPRTALATLFDPGDLVVANDAATLPASFSGTHVAERRADRDPPGRLAVARRSHPLRGDRLRRGRSSHAHGRPAASACACRRATAFGSARSTPSSSALLGHPRLVELRFLGSRAAGACRTGAARPADPVRACPEPLALWDVWTKIAASPVAFEAPSAGFALDWRTLQAWRRARRRLRNAHPCRGHFFDRRSRARLATSVRRAVPHPRAHRGADRAGEARRQPHHRDRHDVSCARWRPPPMPTAGVRAGNGIAQGASRAARRFASSMRFSPASTSPAKAISSCCAPLPTMPCSSASRRRSPRAAIARTSSAIPCCSNARPRPRRTGTTNCWSWRVSPWRRPRHGRKTRPSPSSPCSG